MEKNLTIEQKANTLIGCAKVGGCKSQDVNFFDEAIAHAKEVANTKFDECGKEHQQLAEWLSELNGYKDKTYIEPDFLIRNGFEKRQYDYLYCDDVEEILAQCIDAEMGIWRIYVGFLDSANSDCLNICTVGQLRMFLAIEGLNELAKQLK